MRRNGVIIMNQRKRTRHFQKGFLALVILLSVFLQTGTVAHADLIFEPNDNFYSKNSAACTQVERSFIANGTDGYITVYESPRSDTILTTIPNGTIVNIAYSYVNTDYTIWGVLSFGFDSNNVQSYTTDTGITGWIPMSDLVVCYDSASFIEEHQSEFKEYAGEFDSFDTSTGDVLLYTYPGSGVYNAFSDFDKENISFTNIYTDSEQNVWGYLSYYRASEGWVCLNNPSNKDLPVTEITYDGLIDAAVTLPEPVEPTSKILPIMLIAGLTFAVTALTATMIVIFWKKKN